MFEEALTYFLISLGTLGFVGAFKILYETVKER